MRMSSATAACVTDRVRVPAGTSAGSPMPTNSWHASALCLAAVDVSGAQAAALRLAPGAPAAGRAPATLWSTTVLVALLCAVAQPIRARAAVPAPAAPAPQASATPPVHLAVRGCQPLNPDASVALFDLGVVDPNTRHDVVCSFAIQNTNRAAVRVTAVDASCGCTSVVSWLAGVPAAFPCLLGPGKQLRVDASIHLRALPAGEIDKSVTVYVGGQSAQAASVELRGQVGESLYFIPSVLDFGAVRHGTTLRRLFTLRYESNLWPSGTIPMVVYSGRDAITVSALEVPGARPGPPTAVRGATPMDQTYIATLRAGSDSHPLAGALSVSGAGCLLPDAKDVTRLQLPVEGHLVGCLTVQPAVAAFGPVTSESGTKIRLMLSTSANQLGHLVVTSSSRNVRFRLGHPGLEPVARSRSATLDIWIDPKAPDGILGCTLEIRSSTGAGASIPVSAFVTSIR